MSILDSSERTWYEQASSNLRSYLVQLENFSATLDERGVDIRPTQQLLTEVNRSLPRLEELVTEGDRKTPIPV